MNLRDALVQQSPSLALQRAAADRIAELEAQLDKVEDLAYKNSKAFWEAQNKICDLEYYLESQGLTKDFEEWLARNTEE